MGDYYLDLCRRAGCRGGDSRLELAVPDAAQAETEGLLARLGVAPEAEVVEEMTSEHVAFLQAILADDLVRARNVLSDHIRGQKAVLERILVPAHRRADR